MSHFWDTHHIINIQYQWPCNVAASFGETFAPHSKEVSRFRSLDDTSDVMASFVETPTSMVNDSFSPPSCCYRASQPLHRREVQAHSQFPPQPPICLTRLPHVLYLQVEFCDRQRGGLLRSTWLHATPGNLQEDADGRRCLNARRRGTCFSTTIVEYKKQGGGLVNPVRYICV